MIEVSNYKLINMSKSKMKYEFGNHVRFRFGIKYKIYENDDSFKVLTIKKKTNEVLSERVFICRL